MVRLDDLDVQILRILTNFLKTCLGAQKTHPELGYGGSSCKIHYYIIDFHAISLDEMVIGAKTLILSQRVGLVSTSSTSGPLAGELSKA